MGLDLVVEYVAGFGFGLLVFQLVFRSYAAAAAQARA
jgi:hypothetical protein